MMGSTVKSSVRQKKPEQLRTLPVRFDEANVGRLGLISIMSRIQEGAYRWDVDFLLEDGRPARIVCVGTPEFGGYPHGLDNDISSALINLYIEAGAPEDGWFHATAHRVLTRAGLQTTGRYYGLLFTSLNRLRATTYYLTDSWFDTRRNNITTSFNYLERLEYSTVQDNVTLSSGSLLRLRLAPEITASIRARYLRPLDDVILSKLSGPPSRALYRLLEGQRIDPLGESDVLKQFTVSLRDWAQACKIMEMKPTRIRRNLEQPHNDLLALGYLASVEYGGPSRNQTITYRFTGAEVTEPQVLPDPELVQNLGTHRVSMKVATEVIAQFGETRVRERLRKFQLILQSGYRVKSPSGLLLDVIRDDEGKYPDPPGYAGTAVAVARAATLQEEPVQDLSDAERMAIEKARPLEEQIDTCVTTLQGILGRKLSLRDFVVLRDKLSAGLADPYELGRQAVQAAYTMKTEQFLKSVQQFLSQ
jgi:plasmid replication initiation protein